MVGISKFPRKWTTSRDWEKFLKQDSRNIMSYSIFEWNFGNLLLNGTILQFVKPRKKKPGFHYNLPLSYSQKKKKKTSFFFNKRLRTIRLQLLMLKKKPYQIQITKERKCIGIESNMISVEKLQDKDGYKFAPYSDGEQEVFDTHDCQTGRTQCANSQLNFTSLILYKLKNNCSHEISDLALALR